MKLYGHVGARGQAGDRNVIRIDVQRLQRCGLGASRRAQDECGCNRAGDAREKLVLEAGHEVAPRFRFCGAGIARNDIAT